MRSRYSTPHRSFRSVCTYDVNTTKKRGDARVLIWGRNTFDNAIYRKVDIWYVDVSKLSVRCPNTIYDEVPRWIPTNQRGDSNVAAQSENLRLIAAGTPHGSQMRVYNVLNRIKKTTESYNAWWCFVCIFFSFKLFLCFCTCSNAVQVFLLFRCSVPWYSTFFVFFSACFAQFCSISQKQDIIEDIIIFSACLTNPTTVRQ